jgi:hypothetical protein
VLRPAEVPALSLQFAAPPRLVAGLAAGAAAAGVAMIFVDAPGRILLLVLGGVLLVEAVRLAVARPVLVVDSSGIKVRRGGRPHEYPWPAVGRVAPHTSRRLVTTRTLELDVGDTLLVIPSYRLGADPAEVAAAIEATRPGDA